MSKVSDIDVLSPLGVSVSKLAIGDLCFSVSYLDEAKRLPVVESLVYIGKDLGGESDGSLYFQDVDSYYVSGPLTSFATYSADVDAHITTTGPVPPRNLFGFDGLLDELSRCGARNRRAKQADS
jgi:hypothetical protein